VIARITVAVLLAIATVWGEVLELVESYRQRSDLFPP
jgi:hypothetical protein